MSSTELARELWNAAASFRRSRGEHDLATLKSLCIRATEHVARAGIGTVDHIVLSSTLSHVVGEVPQLAAVLEEAGWQWFR